MLKKAYTFIEILVTLSLISLLTSFTYSAYRQTKTRQTILSAANQIVFNLQNTLNLARTGKKDCSGPLKYYQTTISANSNTIQTRAICQTTQGSLKTTTIPNIIFSTSATLQFYPLNTGMQIISPSTNSLDLHFIIPNLTNNTHLIHLEPPNTIVYQGIQ